MSDTYTLELKNFRSIRDVSMDIAPLTVVYGPNGAGKSSLIYGLLTLKNFLTNPNQNLPSLFSYPTLSLGGYNEVVSGHDAERTVSLSLSASPPHQQADRDSPVVNRTVRRMQSTIDVRAHEVEQLTEHFAGIRSASPGRFRSSLDIPFPYLGCPNQSDTPEGISPLCHSTLSQLPS